MLVNMATDVTACHMLRTQVNLLLHVKCFFFVLGSHCCLKERLKNAIIIIIMTMIIIPVM